MSKFSSKIQKAVSRKAAGSAGAAAFLCTCLTHILVLCKVIPFNWIGGGRAETFEEARSMSAVSVAILLAFTVITLLAGKRAVGKVFRVVIWLIFAYMCVNIVLNFLGTAFEKSVMNILCLVAGASLFRLALRDNRS